METITVKELQDALLYTSNVIISRESYLTSIDTIIGDGDHGKGMARGFDAVVRLLENETFSTVYALIREIGVTLLRTMGGASGVIFGTLFIGGITEIDVDAQEIDTVTLANCICAAEQAIEKRGRSKPGQKTMLDALYPAAQALQYASTIGKPIDTALQDAAAAAESGAEASKNMYSQRGRSKNFNDVTMGYPDPGAVSTSIIFRTIADYLKIQAKSSCAD